MRIFSFVILLLTSSVSFALNFEDLENRSKLNTIESFDVYGWSDPNVTAEGVLMRATDYDSKISIPAQAQINIISFFIAYPQCVVELQYGSRIFDIRTRANYGIDPVTRERIFINCESQLPKQLN